MKTALRIAIEFVVLVLLLWFGVRFWLGRSVAKQSGEVRTAVSAPVEVTFDAKGIPQIWAKTDGDAFYALGWVHASERLFQMEMTRRMARGELSEVFGRGALQSDMTQRRLGFAKRADAKPLTPAAKNALQRYVDGVNAWMGQASVLPPEFVLLRIKPRQWTVEDSLAIADYQTWFAHELMDLDIDYQKVIESMGDAGRALIRAGHPWSPPTVSTAPAAPDSVPVADAFSEDLFGAGALRVTAASNSWAVSPGRSATKAALHAADPHLAVDRVPGLWYLAGMHSEEGLSVVGATAPGVPFVIMGHNGSIAWSFTVASVDLVDYYDDKPKSAHKEVIRVKGQKAPRVVEVMQGARGVMVAPKTSLKWAGFDFRPADAADAALRLQKAKTFDEFRRAVTQFGALDVNWVYSDRAGNIGYQLGSPIPVRDFDSFTKQPAADAGTAWRGYVPLDETPWALNPAQGFLASCNNQVVSSTWPKPIPGYYDPYRITRATALLETKRTPDEMKQMQLDLVSGIALRWKSLAAQGAKAAALSEQAKALEKWDGRMAADSREAALFAAWWKSLPRAIFEDDLGAKWLPGRSLVDAALTARSPVIDDKRTPQVESVEDISARAMREADETVKGRTWGEMCQLEVRHPLGGQKLLNRWFGLSRGPFPAEGDAGSLNANFFAFDERTKSFHERVGTSMRFVLDWSDVDAFSLTGALGQSGNPFSDHYDDFLEMSRKGGSWTVPFSREKVFAGRKAVLRLETGR